MKEMLPCPFDGYEPYTWEDRHYSDRFVVECSNCGTSKRSEYSYDDAIDDWNTRYQEPNRTMISTEKSYLEFTFTALEKEAWEWLVTIANEPSFNRHKRSDIELRNQLLEHFISTSSDPASSVFYQYFNSTDKYIMIRKMLVELGDGEIIIR